MHNKNDTLLLLFNQKQANLVCTLLREDIKCTFCTFVSDANEFKNDAYNYSINKRQVLFVLSLHRKHSWKTNFEAEHVVANVWSVVLFG